MPIELQSLSGYQNGAFLQLLNGQLVWGNPKKTWKFVCSDRLTPIPVAANVRSETAPYDFTIERVVVALETTATGGAVEIDVLRNGVSIFGTRPTIDGGEKSSLTAAVAATLSTTAINQGDEIVVVVIQNGKGAQEDTTTATGLVVYLIGYHRAPAAADAIAPSVPTGLTVTTIDADTLRISYNDSTDASGIARYEIRVNGGGLTNQIYNMGLTKPYDLNGLLASTQYAIEIRAIDNSSANNPSAWSAPVNGTTAYTAFWDSVDAKHQELSSPANSLEVIGSGQSGLTSKAVALDSDNDYIEFVWSMDGNWEFNAGRVKLGEYNTNGWGLWYDPGSGWVRHVNFTPTIGDVFRLIKTAGNNVEVRRNGTAIWNSSDNTQTYWNMSVVTYTTSTGQRLAKPTIVM